MKKTNCCCLFWPASYLFSRQSSVSFAKNIYPEKLGISKADVRFAVRLFDINGSINVTGITRLGFEWEIRFMDEDEKRYNVFINPRNNFFLPNMPVKREPAINEWPSYKKWFRPLDDENTEFFSSRHEWK